MDKSKQFSQEDFKKRLKQLRKNRGLPQQTLADRIGISASTIISYEQGDSLPNIKTLYDLCDVLEVDIKYLMGISDINTVKNIQDTKLLVKQALTLLNDMEQMLRN